MDYCVLAALLLLTHVAAKEFRLAQAGVNTSDGENDEIEQRGRKAPGNQVTDLSGTLRTRSTSDTTKPRRSSDFSLRHASSSSSGVSSLDGDTSSLRFSTVTLREWSPMSNIGSRPSSSTASSGVSSPVELGILSPCSSTSTLMPLSDMSDASRRPTLFTWDSITNSEDEPMRVAEGAVSSDSPTDLGRRTYLLSPLLTQETAGAIFTSGGSDPSEGPPPPAENLSQNGSSESASSVEDSLLLPPSFSNAIFGQTHISGTGSVRTRDLGPFCTHARRARNASSHDASPRSRQPFEEPDIRNIRRHGSTNSPCSDPECSRSSALSRYGSLAVCEPDRMVSAGSHNRAYAGWQKSPVHTSAFESSACSASQCTHGGLTPPQRRPPSVEKLAYGGRLVENTRPENYSVPPRAPFILPGNQAILGTSAPPAVETLLLPPPAPTTANRELGPVGGGRALPTPKPHGAIDELENRDYRGSLKPGGNQKKHTVAASFLRNAFTASARKNESHKNDHRLRSTFVHTREGVNASQMPLCTSAPSNGEPSSGFSAPPALSGSIGSSVPSPQQLARTPKDILSQRTGSTWYPSSVIRRISEKTPIPVRFTRLRISSPPASPVATAASPSHNAIEPQNAQQRVEAQKAEENSPRALFRRFVSKCADPSIQQALKALTNEFWDIIDTMKVDTRRPGPCCQDPDICQKDRPQMVLPNLLPFVASQDLINLAKEEGLRLSSPGAQEAISLESRAPSGKETSFVSLVSGRRFTLTREALFVMSSPLHLMVMRDKQGQRWFLEVLIVDCNRLGEEISIRSETARLRALKMFRQQTSLKVNAISRATGLSSMDDVWIFDSEDNEDDAYCLYSVAPFLSVRAPWLADLEALVERLHEEALKLGEQSIYMMRLNLAAQVLALVGSLDSLGALPQHFTLRDFALSPRGTVTCLFPPFLQSSSMSHLSVRTAVRCQSRYSLLAMLSAIWCSGHLDYDLLRNASDWQRDESLYFSNCAPTTPPEVKNLMIQLCSPATVNLYTFLKEKDFNSLEKAARSRTKWWEQPTSANRDVGNDLMKFPHKARNANKGQRLAHRGVHIFRSPLPIEQAP